MHRLLIPLLSLCFFAAPCGLASSVQAGIPIIWGNGEEITEVGQLPPEVNETVAREFGHPVSVGYMYSRFHIYYGDMWTWNGRHVLFHGNNYWTLDDEHWEELLGSSVESKFGKPLLYRFPLGLTLLAAVIVLWTVVSTVCPSDEKTLQKLSKDERYIRVLEKILPNDDHALRTQYQQEELDAAVAELTGQGVPEAKARGNLELMLSTVVAAREIQITELFEVAKNIAASGSPAQSITILEQLTKALPFSDPRYQEAAQLLSNLRDDATRSVEPQYESPPT